MKAFLITADATSQDIDLSDHDPETDLRDRIGALDVISLDDHLDLWSAYAPLIHQRNPKINPIAIEIITRATGCTDAEIWGDAVITTHTDGGLIAPLSPDQRIGLTRIIADIVDAAARGKASA